MAFNTISHRLLVLAECHRLKGWDNPCEEPTLKSLQRDARQTQSRQGVAVRKKIAIVLEPLQARLATCDDGLRGVRDRALPFLTWSGDVPR